MKRQIREQIAMQSCRLTIHSHAFDPESTMSVRSSSNTPGITQILDQALRHPAHFSRHTDASKNEIWSFCFDSVIYLKLPFSDFQFYSQLRVNHFHVRDVFALHLLCDPSVSKIEHSGIDLESFEAVGHVVLLILWFIFLYGCALTILNALLRQENQNRTQKFTLFRRNIYPALILVESPCGNVQVRSSQVFSSLMFLLTIDRTSRSPRIQTGQMKMPRQTKINPQGNKRAIL